MFVHRTVEGLASVATDVPDLVVESPDAGVGGVPLPPAAHALRERGGRVGAYHQSLLLDAPADLGVGRLRELVAVLTDRHDALRLLLDHQENGEDGARWSLQVRPTGTVDTTGWVTRVEVAGPDADDSAAVVSEHTGRAAEGLDPETGDIARFVWFDAGPGRQGRLLVVLHRLAVDGVSWRILRTELAACWRVLTGEAEAAPRPAGTSCRRWAQQLVAAAQDPERERELDGWKAALTAAEPRLTERPSRPGPDAPDVTGTLHRTLPAHRTGPLLDRVPAAFHCEVEDVLLTALALAVPHWRRRQLRDHLGGTSVLVDLEHDGREAFAEGQDLSRTLGRFASAHPVRLDAGAVDRSELTAGGTAVGNAVKAVKEQLRAVPDGGVGYGMLRYLNPRTAPVLAELPPPDIGFTHLGRFDGAAPGEWPVSAGPTERAPGAGHALELTTSVVDGPEGPCLTVACAWPGELFGEAAVRELVDDWFRALDAITTRSRAADAGGHTPSDLSLTGLDQGDIDVLEADGRYFSS